MRGSGFLAWYRDTLFSIKKVLPILMLKFKVDISYSVSNFSRFPGSQCLSVIRL